MPSDVRTMLVDSATRLFADHVDSKTLDAAKRDGWSPALWKIVEDAQLALVSVPEEAGGAGGTLSDLAAVLRIAGYAAAPVPLAETAIAAWMLAEAGLEFRQDLSRSARCKARNRRAQRGAEWKLSGRLKRVPLARIAIHLVLLLSSKDGDMVACVDARACVISAGRNLASEPRDDVELDDVSITSNRVAPASAAINHADVAFARRAVTRTVAMAGALEKALALATATRPNARNSAARSASSRPFSRSWRASLVKSPPLLQLHYLPPVRSNAGKMRCSVAAAKIRTAQAAHEGAMIAHQVHGAIGVTDEYALHHSTLRLWSWREEFGNEAAWAWSSAARCAPPAPTACGRR